jgi:LPS export ABC transporter protein LptC
MKEFIFSIIIALMFAGCEEKIKPEVDTTLNDEKIPTQESWNAQVFFSEDGIRKAVLFADHLQKFEDENLTYLDNVKIDFYDENENISSVLTSKRGRVNELSRDMFAIDSVVAISDSGVVLTTDELVWKNKEKKIMTDKFVTIIVYNIIYYTNLDEK